MSATANIGTPAQAGAARTWAPALACLGIVFGDIGTSPLYALSATAKAVSPAGDVSPHAVLGIVSLIFWSLIIVICIKYAILIMHTDGPWSNILSERRATQAVRE
jgi:KUP system potassium uptake protein